MWDKGAWFGGVHVRSNVNVYVELISLSLCFTLILLNFFR
jgi:hypothetical protein